MKNQSKRLTGQHKSSQGVLGIFGDEAKLHDMAVSELSQYVVKRLEEKYPKLLFRHRSAIKKEEINQALRNIDDDLGQTIFVPNSGYVSIACCCIIIHNNYSHMEHRHG